MAVFLFLFFYLLVEMGIYLAPQHKVLWSQSRHSWEIPVNLQGAPCASHRGNSYLVFTFIPATLQGHPMHGEAQDTPLTHSAFQLGSSCPKRPPSTLRALGYSSLKFSPTSASSVIPGCLLHREARDYTSLCPLQLPC